MNRPDIEEKRKSAEMVVAIGHRQGREVFQDIVDLADYTLYLEAENAELRKDHERLGKLERLVKESLHQRIEIIKVKATIQVSWGTEHLGRYHSQGGTLPEAIDALEVE